MNFKCTIGLHARDNKPKRKFKSGEKKVYSQLVREREREKENEELLKCVFSLHVTCEERSLRSIQFEFVRLFGIDVKHRSPNQPTNQPANRSEFSSYIVDSIFSVEFL